MKRREAERGEAAVVERGKAKLLWVDLEMTGLDPEQDRILEVAVVATGWDLEPLAEMTAVVKVPEQLMLERMVGEFWEKNAETRENLMRQNAEGWETREVEKSLLEFVAENFGGKMSDGAEGGGAQGLGAEKVILAGNSIHQDRKFIDREWPQLVQELHYRMLDVSAWKVYFEGALGKKFLKREEHRALDDIRGSIEELKWYLSFLKEGK